jgi:hypothetical protein
VNTISTRLIAVLAVSISLSLSVANVLAKPLLSNSSGKQDMVEISPVEEGTVMPSKPGVIHPQSSGTEEQALIQVPAPGVPVDERTYRQMKQAPEREDETREQMLIDVPPPGVPVDERTYRQMKQ